jgi:hypothetical protein
VVMDTELWTLRKLKRKILLHFLLDQDLILLYISWLDII